MSHHPYRSSAPLGVKTLALSTGLDALLSFAIGMAPLSTIFPLGLFMVVVGILQALVAVGIWQLEPYAYPWGIAMFALSALTDLFRGQIYGAGLSLINIYVLYHYHGLFRE